MTEKDKSTVLLEYSLKKLKLPTVIQEYAALAHRLPERPIRLSHLLES